MKMDITGVGNCGGVYRILNKLNGRVYIGSTSRFKDRARKHINDLKANRHQNMFMQNDFNKCGEDCFVFEVIEVITTDIKEDRLLCEQRFIDQFYDNQKNCYNITPRANDIRGKRNGKAINPETDRRCRPKSEAHKQAIGEGSKAAWEDPTYRATVVEKIKRSWAKRSEVVERGPVTVTNIKTGESITIEGSFRGFCTERNLSYKAFHQMISGKIKTSGGWYVGTADNRPEYVSQVGQKRKPLSAEHRNKIAGGKFRGVELLHEPTGEVCKLGDNVKAWALSKGLHYTTVIKVLGGKCKSCGGWARQTVVGG